MAVALTSLQFMASSLRCLCLGVLLIVATVPAFAQSAGAPSYSQDELDQLLAPVALYPDQLLTQILIAATYPLEVVEAARFVQASPSLQGEALDNAVAERNWDPSVQSLSAYPQVLAMMNDNLEWTHRLGDAFLADQARVMDTVQALRQRAQSAGNLASTPQFSVTTEDNDIAIEPAQPDVVYIPVYNPQLIYGPWWAAAYPPWLWCPPTVYGYPFCPVYTVGILFGASCAIWYNHWGWAHPYWHGHRIAINVSNNRFWSQDRQTRVAADGTWQHSPAHRRGVAYPNTLTRERFTSIDPGAVRSRQDFRGYERVPAVPNASQRVPVPSASVQPFDPGYSRQQTQLNAQRGLQSRQSMPFTPEHSVPAAVGRGPVAAPPPARAPQGGAVHR